MWGNYPWCNSQALTSTAGSNTGTMTGLRSGWIIATYFQHPEAESLTSHSHWHCLPLKMTKSPALLLWQGSQAVFYYTVPCRQLIFSWQLFALFLGAGQICKQGIAHWICGGAEVGSELNVDGYRNSLGNMEEIPRIFTLEKKYSKKEGIKCTRIFYTTIWRWISSAISVWRNFEGYWAFRDPSCSLECLWHNV